MEEVSINNAECTRCPIMSYYSFIGKKWSYPLLMNIRSDKGYSFERLISITNRKMSRSMLANFIKQALEFRLLEKRDGYYYITPFGKDIKSDLLKIRKKIESELQIECDYCLSRCIVNHSRV